jgi:hypothetical protein
MWLAMVSPLIGQRWAAGLAGGLNAARVSFENPTADALAKATPGIHLAAIVLTRVGSATAIRSGLAFTQKGFDSDDEQVKLAYLEVPLFLQIDFPVALAPRLFAGPVASFEVGCESRRVPGVGSVQCDDVLAGLQRATVDFGLALGAGMGFGAGPGCVVVDLWANSGLTNINRETTPPGAARNRALYLTVGYVVPLGGTE